MTVCITVCLAAESPLTPDVARLLAQSDACAAALYPAESNHMLAAEALAQPHVLFYVARVAGEAAGCGALLVKGNAAEIKRMFVQETARGLGLGRQILHHLEAAAARSGIHMLRLETGVASHAACRLYESCGYSRIPPFGGYADDPLSLFYEKRL